MNEVIRIKVDGMPKTSVVIAEAHTLVRHALVALVREARPEWNCNDVDGMDELRTRITECAPTLVLIDLRLCALEGLRHLRRAFPETTFVVLSDQDDRGAKEPRDEIPELREAGLEAVGEVHKITLRKAPII